MKSTEKEKMCATCEGMIPYEIDVCPYCGTEQIQDMHNSFQTPLFHSQSLEESLTSLYTPPYMGRRPQFAQKTESTTQEEPPMTTYNRPPIYKEVTKTSQMDPLFGATVEKEEAPPPNSFFCTLLLTVGANFSILGLIQLFFSKNGILRLEWNANYWFFYCLIGAPLIFFGMKKLRAFRE